MGHDILKYQGHHALFNDKMLWVLRCFLLEEALRRESAHPDSEMADLRVFFEGWEWLGPGVVAGTDFDKFFDSHAHRRQHLLEHLQQTGDRIAVFGEFIPVSYMNEHIDCGPPAWTHDYPTERLLKQLGRICNLLTATDRSEREI